MGFTFVNILSIVTFLATFIVAMIIFNKKPRTLRTNTFFLFTLSVCLWILTNLLVDLSVLFHWNSLLLAKITLIGPAFIPVLLLLFASFFVDKKFSIINRIFLMLPSLLLVIITPTAYNIESVYVDNGLVGISPGIGYYFLFLYFLIYFVWSIYLFVRQYMRSKGVEKEQIKYILAGIGVSIVLGVLYDLVLPLFGINSLVSLGPVSVSIFVIATAYAIIAHQLFDIRVIIKRTVVYSGLLLFTLATYSMVIFFFTALFGGEEVFDARTFAANIVAAMLVAVGFDPIRKYLTKITDKYLFKGEYDPQQVLATLSTKLSESVDIRQAAQSLVSIIKSEIRLERAALITITTEDGKTLIKEAVQDGYPDPSILQNLSNTMFLSDFNSISQIIITDNLRRECANLLPSDARYNSCQQLVVELDSLRVSIAIPILVAQKVIGIFLVGEKLSGDAFSKNEVDFLGLVASQTANSIEKARLWEEDQMKSEFVSIASHELLTPTAAIKGYLTMILEEDMGQVDDQARRYLEKVRSSADRLARLVEDLLNVSRIESGRIKINKKAFSLVESAQKAAEELQVNAKNKQLDLAFVTPPVELPLVYADTDHVYRVLINLVGNAIKYTPTGWVRCFVTQYDQQHLLFAVSDSGLGIPKDSINHLFEKFNRADRKEIAGIQGTGLGLYISKKIVELMGGQMWVESEVGKGSTFFFTLPVTYEPIGATTTEISQNTPPPVITSPVISNPPVAPTPQPTFQNTPSVAQANKEA